MSRTNTTFGLLQATAAVVALAVLFWSVGALSFRFAEAANVTSFSDTLSDSAPSAGSDHTIEFVSADGATTGQDIVITYAAGFNLAGIGQEDIDLIVDSVNVATTSWSVGVVGQVITITLDSTSIPATTSVEILIGNNATDGTPDTQIVNPGTQGSYELTVAVGASDTGSTQIAIVDSVTVSASVPTQFTFTVSGLAGGETVNGTTTTGSSTATTIPFGLLEAGVATTVAQQLSVETNAKNGFVVTVQVDDQLVTPTGEDINGFIDGAFTSSPTAWTSPSGTLGNEDTYGHWGLTTNDSSLTGGDIFGNVASSSLYVSASTTPVEVFSHTGSADGTTPHIGRTEVGYTIEITALQEASDDYETTLTYVATPVF